MNLQSEHEVQVTRRKLRDLEELYEGTRTNARSDEHVRELTLRSLKKLINQFKEEIARYECRVGARGAHSA
jgi:hypothetical protein